MKENAAINGVLDRMSIHGYADRNFYKAIDPLRLPTSVLLELLPVRLTPT
jgi:hypothetical protein